MPAPHQNYKPPWWATLMLPYIICGIAACAIIPVLLTFSVSAGRVSEETAGNMMLAVLVIMVSLTVLSMLSIPLRLILRRAWVAKQPAMTLDDLIDTHEGWVFMRPEPLLDNVFVIRLQKEWPQGESVEVRIDKAAFVRIDRYFRPEHRRLGTAIQK